ncbi:hypothetical protein BH11PSE7_BH11PSE7_21250 [soil metagenome]
MIFTTRALQWAAALLTACCMQAVGANPLSDIDYRLGEGLKVPGTGLTLGGYATAGLDDLKGNVPRAAIDNISLFIWWEGEGRWKFFGEFDSENTVGARGGSQNGGKRYVALERLYADYAWNDTTTIRLGKFLTPIGRWNLIHATPLVWTTSRPLVTTGVFPTNSTGVMVNGTVALKGQPLEYSVYASDGSDVLTNPSIDPFNEALGMHFTLPLAGARLGASLATFEQKKTRGDHKQLLGLDFLWTRNRYEVSAEGVYRFSGKGSSWEEKGAFIQGVVPLTERLYAVGRYETFRKALEPAATRQWVAGLNFRLTPAVVLKAEWIGAKHNKAGPPEGFMSSLSVLF